LRNLGCTNVHYVSGYRPALLEDRPIRQASGKFRLVFVSQIVREKGPLLLLEALRLLASDGVTNLTCDFYGPVLDDDRDDFFQQLEATPSARYRGTVKVGMASKIMSEYDALVFPTCWSGEGQPGVIIEAMLAGIPVISTQFQAVTDLIADGDNGFVVPAGDSRALVAAIKRLAFDHGLWQKMARSNYERGQEFRSDKVVRKMVEIMFPDLEKLLARPNSAG
jgi:glycosyltransferase involved in cell wall biosynthesis